MGEIGSSGRRLGKTRTRGPGFLAFLAMMAGTTCAFAAVTSSMERLDSIGRGITVELVCDATPGSGNGCRIGPPGGETPVTDLLGQSTIGQDAQGRLLTAIVADPRLCGGGVSWDLSLVRILADLETTEPVLRILSTCNGDLQERSNLTGLLVDLVSGTALIVVETQLLSCPTLFCSEVERIVEVLRVRNLGSLLDIVLTYEPPAALSFNVPARPEGLPVAGSFSVWSGEVGDASALALAAPLDCTVPAGRLPVPGEILTVPDTTAAPPEGEAVYFLVATGPPEGRRAGRTFVDGMHAGRDAAALTGCF